MPPLLELPFTNGLDQGTDPRRTAKLITLQNYVWTKRGMIEKRSGYGTIPTLIAPTTATSSVASVTVTAGGSGYTTPEFFVLGSGGGGAGFVGLASSPAGIVLSVTLVGSNAPGYGYTSPPTLLWNEPGIGGGSGTGAAATVTLTEPTGAGGSISQAFTLATSPQGILQTTDGTSVYAYASDTELWSVLGPLQNVGIETVNTPLLVQMPPPLVSGSTVNSVQSVDWFVVACGSKYVWWPASANAAVQDKTSGAFEPTNMGLAFTQGALDIVSNVVTDGARYVWKFYGGTTGTAAVSPIYWTTLDLGVGSVPPHQSASQAFPNPITSTSIIVQQWFDCYYDPSSSRLIAAYVVSGDTHITFSTWTWDPVLQVWDPSSLSGTTPIGAAATSVTGLCVSYGTNSGNVYFAWSWVDGSNNVNVNVGIHTSSGLVVANVYRAATSTVTNAITNLSILETDGGSDFHVAFTAVDCFPTNGSSVSGFSNCIHSVQVSFVGTPLTMTITQGFALASRLYNQGGHPHALAYNTAGSFYEIMDFEGVEPWQSSTGYAATPAIKLAYINPRVSLGSNIVGPALLYNNVRGTCGTLATAVYLAPGEWMLPTTIAPEPASSAVMSLQQCLVTYGQPLTAPVSGWTSMVYPGSTPSVAGANTVREVQFMHPPTITSVLQFASGNLGAGKYEYVATYARANDDGSITESPPSLPFTITSPGNVNAILGISTYAMAGYSTAAIPGDVLILVYRTSANGTVLNRIQEDPFTGTPLLNVTNVPGVIFADNNADATIAPNPELYTSGDVFDNVCPSICTIAARVRDRVYLSGTPDGFTVYYSDPVQNSGTTNFHDEQVIYADDGGPVTAIGAVDSNTFIFKASSIYVVYGVEGTNNGSGNTLSNPTKVPTGDIGCISQASIVTVPQGIMFQSARGIELLDRNLSIQFIGEPVKDATSGQAVVDAIEVPTQYQVRFFLGNGSVAVYSITTGEWSTFNYPFVTGASLSATTYQGVVTWLSVGPTIQQEMPGVYLDAFVNDLTGQWITSAFTTGQITLGEGLQGYRRYQVLQMLGTWAGESGATISVSADYGTSPVQSAAWTSAQIEAIPGFNSNRVQLEVRPVVQRAEAVQISFVDSAPVDGLFTKGIVWESISFEVVAKQGRYRGLSSAAKA